MCKFCKMLSLNKLNPKAESIERFFSILNSLSYNTYFSPTLYNPLKNTKIANITRLSTHYLII